jgi:hypothetical protein
LGGTGALAHLHKDQGAVGLAHNQIDLTADAPGCLEIAPNQAQTVGL